MNHIIVKGVDLATFSFDFNAIFYEKEAFLSFCKFQETEYNVDALLFVHECMDLERIPYPEKAQEAISLALHIYDAYIQNAASTSTAKKQLQKLFTSSKQEECTNKWLLTETYATPAAAFEAVKSSVLMDLKADSFKRFLTSPIFVNFLQSKSKEYILSLGLPKAAVQYNYTDNDFEEGSIVTDADFRFMEMILEDNYGWELLSRPSKKKHTVMSYYTSKNYLPNVKWAQDCNVAKYTIILPFGLDYCVTNMISSKSFLAAFPHLTDATEDEFISPNDMHSKHGASKFRGCAKVRYTVSMPFPITQTRRMCSVCSVEYKPDMEQVLYISKPYATLKHALPSKWIDMQCFYAWMFRKIDQNRTLLCQVQLYNAGGWTIASKSMSKMIVPAQGADMQKNLVNFLQKQEKQTNTVRSDMIAKCLTSCQMETQRQAHKMQLQQ